MFGDKSIINLKPAAAHGERTGLRIPTYPCCIILRYQIRRIITAPAFIVHQSSDFSFVLSLRMHGVRHLLLLEYHVAGTDCYMLHPAPAPSQTAQLVVAPLLLESAISSCTTSVGYEMA